MGVYIGQPVIISDMQGPCPDGFHVPLQSEWGDLFGIFINTLGIQQRVSNVETYLKMPRAGYRNYAYGTAQNRESGGSGNYWSSTGYNNDYAYYLRIGVNYNQVIWYDNTQKTNGNSIRCFKNEPVVPDNSWTVLYQGSGSAGIYHNSSLGLISISGDGTTWITIADKNLGATTVYNSGDELNDDNCGGLFQRGNNYMFLYSGGITTSSTQVDASTYGPGNYYSSSTFITRSSSPYNWDNSNNQNLRGGVSQGSSEGIAMSELKNAYIGQGIWKPGANTFGYYTFDDQNPSQITDFSGNNRNLTGGTMPTYTLVSGTNYAGNYTNVSGSVAPAISYATLESEFTMLAWVKITTNSSSYIASLYGRLSSGADHQISIIYGYNSNQFEYFDSYNPTGSSSGELITRTTIKSGVVTDARYLVGFTRGNSVLQTYCNGIAGNSGSYQISSINKSLYLGSSNLGDRFKGQIGECVVENRARTAEEIQAYYNQTKSNYGL